MIWSSSIRPDIRSSPLLSCRFSSVRCDRAFLFGTVLCCQNSHLCVHGAVCSTCLPLWGCCWTCYSVFYSKKKSPRHALGRLGRARDHDAWRPSSHTLARRLASCHRDPTCTPHVWARGVAVALQCTHEINNAQALTTPAPFLRFLWAKLTTTTATRSSSSGYSAWGTNSHGSKCGQHVLSPEITWCSVRWSWRFGVPCTLASSSLNVFGAGRAGVASSFYARLASAGAAHLDHQGTPTPARQEASTHRVAAGCAVVGEPLS